LITSSSCQARQ